MKRSMLILLVVGAWAPAAWGEDTGSSKDTVKVIHEQDVIIIRKKTVVDFSDVAVEGDLTKPDGSLVLHRGQAGFDTRINVRKSFEPELQKSVDHL